MFQKPHPQYPQMVDPQRKDNLVDLRDYIRILSKNWLIVASGALAGLVLALGISAAMSPKYESTTTLYVSVRSGGSEATGDLFQGASFAQSAVTSYIDVATTAIVLDRVADELDTDISRSQLDKMLDVSSPVDSVLISITAAHSDPAIAADVANTTGDVLIDVVENEIEITEGQDSPVQVRMIDPGVIPVHRTSPNLWLNSALGLIIGLTLGIGGALLRGLLDTRIHSVRDLEQLTDAPVVGRIAYDDQITQRPLVVHDDPRSPRAEAFRTLRTSMQFLGTDEGSKVFVVSSAMPNEGKTHVVANLAIVLAESGASVALVDADMRKPRLAEVMGIEGAVGLSDVLISRAELDDVLQPWGTDQLTVLPAGQIPPNPSELLGSTAMQQVINDLGERADYVLIDAPPILPVTDAAVLSTLTTGTLLVAAVGKTKRQDINQALESLETVESRFLGFIVNRVPIRSADVSGLMSYKYGDPEDPEMHRSARLP